VKTPNRRKFIKHSTIAAGTALTLPHSTKAIGANEKITVGIIGPGGMGSAHLGTLCQNKQVNIAYVCDVDEQRTAKAQQHRQKQAGHATGTPGF
jgi:ornithine cyclodeaminase/alanine dehydrogenase-like protein (mu-crystallin family)